MTWSSLRARRGVTIRDRDNRLVSAVTWVAVLAPLPYTVSRVLWAAGVPAGIDPELLRDFHSPGWGSLYILGLAALAEAPHCSSSCWCALAHGSYRDGFPFSVAGRSDRRSSSRRSPYRSRC